MSSIDISGVSTGLGYGERILVVYMTQGVDLLSSVLNACKANGISSGLICYCIGSLKEVNFKSVSYDPSRPAGGVHTDMQRFEGAIQVLNGQGCIGHDETGELFAHMHITFVDGKTGTIFGGDINPGNNPVMTRLEVGIIALRNMVIKAEFDPQDGYHLVPKSS